MKENAEVQGIIRYSSKQSAREQIFKKLFRMILVAHYPLISHQKFPSR